MRLVNRCIEQDPNRRATLEEIVSSLSEIVSKHFPQEKCHGEDEACNSPFSVHCVNEGMNAGSVACERIYAHLYQMLSKYDRISFNRYLDSGKPNFTKFYLLFIVYNHRYDLLGSIESPQLDEQEANDSAEPGDQFRCSDDFVDEFVKGTIRIQKDTYELKIKKYGLGGLRPRAVKQLLLRVGRNIDENMGDKLDISVKNLYDYPYGHNLKLKHIDKMLGEFEREELYPKDLNINMNNNGNRFVTVTPHNSIMEMMIETFP